MFVGWDETLKENHHQDPGEERRAAAASGAIDATQAHGLEGTRVDPTRAAHEAGLDAGDVGSDRYHRALGYLLEEGAVLGDEHTATQTGDRQTHGYALYFFTRRAVKLLEG